MNGFKNDPNKRVTEYGAKNRKYEDNARRTSANHAAIAEGIADVQVGVYSLQPMDADRVARQRAAIDLVIMAREEIGKATRRKIAARFSCRDCGEGGEITGHMGCQYPGDND